MSRQPTTTPERAPIAERARATDVADLASYRAVHHAVRLAARRLAVAAYDLSPNDAPRVRALRRYWNGYSTEVHLHHTLEDDVFFPALAARSSTFTEHAERLAADHHVLDELMLDASANIEFFTKPGSATRAARVLARLADHMDDHLDLEDDRILPLFEEHFSHTEFAELEQHAMKAVGLGLQAAFTVPFVVDSMEPDARADVLATAPTPMRVLYRLTRARHARLDTALFRGAPVPVRAASVVTR